MVFLKEHLLRTDYNWISQNTPSSYTGGATRRLFDRYNGEQILFMINLCASMAENFTIEDGQEIEALIHRELPMESKSEVSVFNWIKMVKPAGKPGEADLRKSY